jgi:uncharacterized membrane protein YcgQ (UPF0703/DUF1980 family)
VKGIHRGLPRGGLRAGGLEPLPGDPDTPTAISFDELSTRANASNGPATLQNRTLKLEGFVAKNKAGAPAGTVRVGRYMIWCRAADASFGDALVRWPAGAPAPRAGAWFTLVGRVQSIATVNGAAVPLLQASQVRAESRPSEPYEH